jgi:hypothetical protein
MGIFSKSPSVYESFGYAVQAFGMGIINLDEETRTRTAPVATAAVQGLISKQSFSEEQKNSTLMMFQIVSGTVGIKPTAQLNTNGKADEVREIIESTLPFNMPIVVLGPIRMVIEEFVTGKSMNDINYEKFDKSDARQLINALMKAIEIVNLRCVQEPKKHPQNEVMCLAYLASNVATHIKEQLV